MSENNNASQSETYDLWDRVGYVEITIGDKKPMVFKGLDFKFHVNKVLASMVDGTMKVDIHGLPQDIINEIVTVCDQTEAINLRKRVKVYAGYRNPDDPSYEGTMLACMDIIYASVTSPPPDLWITIEGVQSAYYRYIEFKYKKEAGLRKEIKYLTLTTLSNTVTHLLPTQNTNGAVKTRVLSSTKIGPSTAEVAVEMWYQQYMTVDQLCEDLVDKINKAFKKNGSKNSIRYESYLSEKTKKKGVPSFEFEGPMSNLTSKIGLAFDVFCYFEFSYGEEDVLIVMDKEDASDEDPMSEEEKGIRRQNKGKKKIRTKKLDVEHGLIGIPTIANTTSLKCRCLLDPNLSVGDYIDITSEVMPVVKSGKPGWQINKISFSGHMRGNNWYTDITAIDFKRLREMSKAPPKKKLDLTN